MQVQNFITLCDGGFLAFALTMLESLRLHFASCRCYILCMDSKAYNYLSTFGPKWITPINLKEIETPELLKVKNERTKREYCWTLSSHCFEAVKKRSPIFMDFVLALMVSERVLERQFQGLFESGPKSWTYNLKIRANYAQMYLKIHHFY